MARPSFSKSRRYVAWCAALCVWLLSATAAFAQSGSLSGRVTAADTGAPLVHSSIYVTGPIDEFVRNVFTDETGTFVVDGLAPGTYFVTATGPPPYRSATFGPPCSGFWCRASSGTPLVVANAPITGIDIVVKRAGSLSGRATNANGSALANARVAAVNTISERPFYTDTDAAGNYELSPLDEGTYVVMLEDRVMFNGVGCNVHCRLDDGTRITVAAGQAIAGINLALPPPPTGSISGLVLNATTGAPIANALVRARNRSTGLSFFQMGQVNGLYSFQALPSGTYSVWSESWSASQVYGGGPLACDDDVPACELRKDAGTPVVVSSGATAGINILVPQGARVTFQLSDIDSGAPVRAQVTLYSESGLLVLPTRYHGSTSGTNVADDIPPGRYYAVASDLSFESRVYGASLSCPEDTCPLTLGTPIVLTAGAQLTLPIALKRRNDGLVTGRVFGPDGRVIIAFVGLYYANGSRAPFAATVMNDDSFRFDRVTPGVYYARTDSQYLDEWFGDVCVGCGTSMGTPILVTGGQTTANVNFTLTQGAEIYGVINRPNRGLATRIDVFDAAGTSVGSAYCEEPSPCAYRVRGLAPGAYRVRAMDSEYGLLAGMTIPQLIGQVHPGIDCISYDCPLDGAAVVTLDAVGPNARQRVDFTLRFGGSVRARAIARGREWFVFPTTFRLQLFDQFGRPAGVNPSIGQNEFVGLTTGTYYLRTVDGYKKGYGDKAWQDVPCSGCPLQSGTPIHVVEGQRVEGMEIVLDPGRTLTGTVIDASTSAPLENVTVRVLSAAGVQVGEAVTGPAGAWRVQGLAPGDYFLATLNTRGYVDELYQDHVCPSCGLSGAQPVTMTANSDTGPVTIALSRAGFIAGAVIDPVGVGVGAVGVELFDAAGTRVARVSTRANGQYHVAVPAGTLYARTEPVPGRNAVLFNGLPCTGGACVPTSGTPIQVALGATTPGINFALQGCPSFALRAQMSAIRYLNTASDERFVVLGGTAPFTFSLLNGVLPAGWNLDPVQGVASGVTTAAGQFSFEVGVVDAAGCSAAARYTISVLGCRVSLAASTLSFPASASTRDFAVRGACAAEVFESSDWIQPLPFSITTPTTLQIAVRQNFSGSPREAVVQIGDQRVTVRQAGALSANAFGFLDLPRNGERVTGAIAVGGWALDDIEVARIRLYRDPVAGEPAAQLIYLGDGVLVRGARPDVESFFPTYSFNDRAGWGFLLLTNMLPNQGNGTFRLHAYADDIEGHRTLLGSTTIVAENATAVHPFGAIDTPGQGETIRGAAYVNFGWVLTPLPKSIPSDGSTITVLIDGAVAGNVNYGHYRVDVASLFPGLSNSLGAIGHRLIDTTLLSDGIHTISWIVTDSAGVTQGIGSRYFHVDNAGQASSTTSSAQAAAVPAAMPAQAVAEAGPARGVRRVQMREMERVQLDLRRELALAPGCAAAFSGAEIVGDGRRPLPAGSALDPVTGAFTWQPGPGFVGNYRLTFTAVTCDGAQENVPVDVAIRRPAR